MNVAGLAEKWRVRHGYVGRGGVIVIYDGIVNSWVNELRNPGDWCPGCIAVDESGQQWVSVGGNDQRGAARWEQVHTI